MRMTQLSTLYYAMKRENRTMEQFRFKLKQTCFDIIFVIDTVPFQLLVGIKTYNFFFTVPVDYGFKVGAIDDGTFYALRSLLNFSKTGEKFTSLRFLKEVDNHAPSNVARRPVQPHELFAMMPPEKRRKVEEADKIYFVRWDYHLNDGRKARNFEKTLLMTGSQEIADFCRAHNISSVWTDRAEEGRAFTPPCPTSEDIPPDAHLHTPQA